MSWLLLLLLAQSEYHGTLAPELSPYAIEYTKFELASPAQREKLGAPGARIFAGKIDDADAFVVEGASSAFYVDAGRLVKYALRPYAFTADETAGFADVALPLAGPVFKTYPVRVYVFRAAEPADSCGIAMSRAAMVAGSAKINGQKVDFKFEFDRRKNTALPDNGWQVVDGQPDFLHEERPVYHAAGAYFSVESIDLNARTFTLAARTAAEYRRILLKPGEIFPDFTFTDLDGRVHRLSDYGGKRVLLDFWATWCAPCMADLPKVRALHDRGLQIIGMNVDRDPRKPRAMNLPWPQATLASIRDIVERRARIEMYPTYVLLDGDRKIIAGGEHALK